MPHFPKAPDFRWLPAKFATLLFPQARSSALSQSHSRVNTIMRITWPSNIMLA